jgi:hypothetical protein
LVSSIGQSDFTQDIKDSQEDDDLKMEQMERWYVIPARWEGMEFVGEAA